MFFCNYYSILLLCTPQPKRGRSQNSEKNTVQYGNKKCGTRARVLSPTLARGNGKNEIRQLSDKKRSPEGLSEPNQNTIIMNIIINIS